jgi:hypothetical protein
VLSFFWVTQCFSSYSKIKSVIINCNSAWRIPNKSSYRIRNPLITVSLPSKHATIYIYTHYNFYFFPLSSCHVLLWHRRASQIVKRRNLDLILKNEIINIFFVWYRPTCWRVFWYETSFFWENTAFTECLRERRWKIYINNTKTLINYNHSGDRQILISKLYFRYEVPWCILHLNGLIVEALTWIFFI